MYHSISFNKCQLRETFTTIEVVNISFIAQSFLIPFCNLSLPFHSSLRNSPGFLFTFSRVSYKQNQSYIACSFFFFVSPHFLSMIILSCWVYDQSLLLLCNIPLYGYTTVCLSIYLLMNIWVIVDLGLLGTKLLGMFK